MVLLVISATYREFDIWKRIHFPFVPKLSTEIISIKDSDDCVRAQGFRPGEPYIWLSGPAHEAYVKAFLKIRRCIQIELV